MFKQGSKYIEIEIGSRVCKLIKNFYFAETAWVKCNKQVSTMFTSVKLLAKRLYVDIPMKDILNIVIRYDKQDFEDLLSGKKD